MAKDIWLVKSSGHILGPYKKNDVIKMLRSKELVVLDEVAKPCQRWTYIRDQKGFKEIVEEIRTGQIHPDDTTTDILSTNTQTFTETGETISDELTEEINIGLDEIVYENVQETGGKRKTAQTNTDSFAFEGDRAVKEKARETVRLLWFVTVGIIVAVLAFVMFKQFVKAPQNKQKIVAEKIKAAISDLEVGEYQKALVGFKEAYELEPTNTSIYIYLGSLLVQVEGQTVQGQRLLQKVLDLGERYPRRAVTGLGLAALADGDSKRADEYFDKALDIDPIYLPARINLGASALGSSQYQEANNHLHLAVKDGAKEGATYIMLAESFIKLWERSGQIDYLDQAKNMLEKFAPTTYDYRQELDFLLMYINHLKGELNDVSASVTQLLDMDPYQTRMHRHNIFVYRKRAEWETFLKWCQDFSNKHRDVNYIKTLEALCFIKAGNRIKANQLIDDAVNQNPKDPLIQAVYAYILDELGLGEQSSVAMGRAIEFDARKEFKLPFLLQARFCQDSGDKECSQLYWQQLLQIEPRSLPAIAGVAHNHLKNESYTDAKKYISRGLRLSANYRPFLKLQRQMKVKGFDGASEPKGL